MPTYEILNSSNTVINRVVADLEFVQNAYPGKFREYVEPQRQFILPKIITKLSFRFRLTDSEYVAILNASKNDVAVQAWVETFNMVTQIDLDDQRTKDGVALLVSKSLLTQARANTILTAPVQDSERPTVRI